MSTALTPLDGLRVKEVAFILQVSPKTVYRWCYEGTITFYRVFGSVRIARADVEAAKRNGTSQK